MRVGETKQAFILFAERKTERRRFKMDDPYKRIFGISDNEDADSSASAPVNCSTADSASDSADVIFQRLIGIKVICGDCKKRVNLNYSYRCYDCDYWFCKDCAKIHFKR